MATKRRGGGNDANEDGVGSAVKSDIKKLTNIAALLVVKGEKQEQKIITLSAAGFRPREIADLLWTTTNTVNVTLSKARKKRGD